jgi:threonine/homoserine/homoserine lactone efflux protein
MLIFLFEAMLISLSGVMAPGPITAVVVGKGSDSPHAGAFIALGHGVVEMPLMVAVLVGITRLLGLPYVKSAIGMIGAVFLLIMAFGMLRSLRQQEARSIQIANSPFGAGIVLSLANPYFFVWWATIGAALIARSLIFGLWGFVALALCHWLCDFVWDYSLSVMSFKGSRFFGRRFQKLIFVACGIALFFFSGRLLIDAIRELLA